jgi:UDP-N-acetylglucosamine diphosphorylase / glucose-1-phosphate thymidylyltransferase / UDP-N-acetylgalactosamine diphosphorylase / glucosamine-1-phosphate N-acetyltransferase / galactosamine-1-phosphate N-acetyltransferase
MSGICIFEDEGYAGLLPLTWFKPVFDLRCGMTTIYEKIKRYYPRTNIYLLCRDYLEPVAKKGHPGTFIGKFGKESSILFLNGRLLCDKDTPKNIPVSGGDEIFVSGDTVVAARLSKGNFELIANSLKCPVTKNSFDAVNSTAKTTKVTARMIGRFYDLIAENGKEITNDFSFLTRGGVVRGRVHQTVAVYGRGGIFIDDGADVEAFVTLDARNGPVYISKGAKVLPYSRIEGPCVIGERSTINTGANIRAGSTIGPSCKVGGEVEETIFQGYSNKQHYGFLGHSFIGEWVNMGAGVTNSDLKNTYNNVNIKYCDTETDSGKQFLGCAVADHAKLGIGVMINTGAMIGAVTNYYGAGMTPKFVPSFSWGNSAKLVKYDPEKAIKTAKVVMSRRDVDMEEAEVDLMMRVFELTEYERACSGVV